MHRSHMQARSCVPDKASERGRAGRQVGGYSSRAQRHPRKRTHHDSLRPQTPNLSQASRREHDAQSHAAGRERPCRPSRSRQRFHSMIRRRGDDRGRARRFCESSQCRREEEVEERLGGEYRSSHGVDGGKHSRAGWVVVESSIREPNERGLAHST